MAENPVRIKSIQALRGVAIVLVVCFHLAALEGKYGRGDMICPDFLKAGASGVDFFFVISGLVLTLSSRNLGGGFSAGLRFLGDRLTRIFPLYWVYSLTTLGIYLIKPSWVNAMEQHQVNLLASFLLLPQDRLPLLAVGWVLIHQMYFYLGFAFLNTISPKNRGALLALWAVLAAGGAFLVSSPGPSFSWSWIAVHPLTLEFIGGGFIGLALLNGRYRFGWASLVLGLAIWTGAAILVFGMGQRPLPTGWERLAWFGLPALLIVYGVVALEFQGGFRRPAFLQALGDASYSIYLSHILVLSGLGRLWKHYGLEVPGGNLLMLVIMLTGVFLWGFLNYYHLEKGLTLLTRRSGGRRR